MAQSFLIFNFGKNEDAAQQARHRLEGWRQSYRLGNKLQFKFERRGEQTEEKAADETRKKSAKSEHPGEQNGDVRVIVRLDFSSHEKQTFQSWLARIPGEEPFKSIKPEVVRNNEAGFEAVSDLFISLD